MQAYFFRRVILAVPTLLVVATVAFAILHAVPGDTAAIMAGPEATDDQVQAIRSRLGLDAPLHVQYFAFISRLAVGNLGDSLYSGRSVVETIVSRLEPTLLLTG